MIFRTAFQSCPNLVIWKTTTLYIAIFSFIFFIASEGISGGLLKIRAVRPSVANRVSAITQKKKQNEKVCHAQKFPRPRSRSQLKVKCLSHTNRVSAIIHKPIKN